MVTVSPCGSRLAGDGVAMLAEEVKNGRLRRIASKPPPTGVD